MRWATFRYAWAPRELEAVDRTLRPAEGASAKRTDFVMGGRITVKPYRSSTSAKVRRARLVRPSYIVGSTPRTDSSRLHSRCTSYTVSSSCRTPRCESVSHCIGMSTESAAVSALTVSTPSDGEQSMRMSS